MNKPAYPWIANYDAGVVWDMNFVPRAVHSLMDETAQMFKQHPAFDFLGKKYSWGEIGDLVNRFAEGLQHQGVRQGDKVGLFLPNSPYFLVAYYAALKIGATVVNFNPLYAERELIHQINDSDTSVMITADLKQLYNKLRTVKSQTALKKLIVCRFTDILPFPKNILFQIFKSGDIADVQPSDDVAWFSDLIKNDGRPYVPVIDPLNDIAVLQYTGGTTGVPKGAMLTHYNITSNAEQSIAWFQIRERGVKRMLGVLPFFHVFAMTTVMNLSVLAAMEIIALPRFDLKQTLRLIKSRRPHFFPAVPAIYTAINNCPGLKNKNLSSLEYCISGGAPLPVFVKRTFEAKTGCTVVEGYGLTESSPVACINPVKGENKPGSIGLPIPGTIVEIISMSDKTTKMPLGERGELCVRGPQVMKGYWKKPKETEDVLREGRLYTGDIAVMDDRGYIYIVDRLKDMIITNGYNVYPRNIEEAIYMHPAVEECIVAGLPDAERGEIVKAWIKLKTAETLTEQQLRDFLTDKISRMEIPKVIEFRNEPLPKTMIGKLSRKDVKAQEKG